MVLYRQRVSSKIHVVKDLFCLSYKRVHVGEAFVLDYKIIYIIRKPGVKTPLDLVQSWFACKNDQGPLVSIHVSVCLWESFAPHIPQPSPGHSLGRSTSSLIPPTPGEQRKEEIPHSVNFPLCKSRMEQECGGVFLQTLEKCVFKAPFLPIKFDWLKGRGNKVELFMSTTQSLATSIEGLFPESCFSQGTDQNRGRCSGQLQLCGTCNKLHRESSAHVVDSPRKLRRGFSQQETGLWCCF